MDEAAEEGREITLREGHDAVQERHFPHAPSREIFKAVDDDDQKREVCKFFQKDRSEHDEEIHAERHARAQRHAEYEEIRLYVMPELSRH